MWNKMKDREREEIGIGFLEKGACTWFNGFTCYRLCFRVRCAAAAESALGKDGEKKEGSNKTGYE